MPPDGPDRDDASSTPIVNYTDETTLAIPFQIFREAPTGKTATQMHIWTDDGTRVEMKMCLANVNEVRGWHTSRANRTAFVWPFVEFAGTTVFLSDDDTVVKKEGATVANFGKMVVSPGDMIAFHACHGTKAPVQFIFFDQLNETVILRKSYGPTAVVLEELPVGKFLDDYCPFQSRVKGSPLPFACSMLTIAKAVIKLCRLHNKAQEKKFAPGGLGFKRALETSTAQTMKRARVIF